MSSVPGMVYCIYCNIPDIHPWASPECLFQTPCPLLSEVPEPWQTPRHGKGTLWVPKLQTRGGRRVGDTRSGELPPFTPPLWAFPRCANIALKHLPPAAERRQGIFKASFHSPNCCKILKKLLSRQDSREWRLALTSSWGTTWILQKLATYVASPC